MYSAAALECEAIKGAGLDVFDVEPLPSSSRLWTLPNVFISPHSTARSVLTNGLLTVCATHNSAVGLRLGPGQHVAHRPLFQYWIELSECVDYLYFTYTSLPTTNG
jgi:hypothetical protein